ncbi:hypothetical protein P8X24_10965 [Pyrococcus kukulkanii]|uniref:hypothetical protein n=1 Tax=Pyrococcus kukulkanii TaxID=1609559 RepID=UPI003564C602
MVWEGLFEKKYWVDDRAKHREKVVQYLREFVKKKDRESLRKLLNELWASEAFQVDAAIEMRILARGFTFEEVANKLALALTDPDRLLDEKVPGFGPSSITEILFSIDPNKYPLFNKRAVVGLKRLGYEDFEGAYFSRATYARFADVAERFFQDYRAVKEYIESKINASIPKFEFVDGILNLVYEGKLTPQELEELKRQAILDKFPEEEVLNYAVDSVKRALEQYFNWLKKGDPEDRAVEKAAGYVVGMMVASATDKRKKETLILTLGALAQMAEKIAKFLRELD